jgi:hypothetical protein
MNIWSFLLPPAVDACFDGGWGMKRIHLRYLVTGLVLVILALPAWAQQEGQEPNQDEVTIPEGTEFKLQLHTTINSKTSKQGDRVLSSLLDPVAVEDRDALPKGVRIDGHTGEVRPAGRRGKGGYLSVVFDTVELPNGQKIAILGSLTEIFSSEGTGDPNVGSEGELKGRGPARKKQAVLVAGAAAAGAAVGSGTAIATGTSGLVAVLLFSHGKQASLAAGSLVGMRLDRDVTLSLPSSGK